MKRPFLSVFLITVCCAILSCSKTQNNKDPEYCWECHDVFNNPLIDTCNLTREELRSILSCAGIKPAPDSCVDKFCTYH